MSQRDSRGHDQDSSISARITRLLSFQQSAVKSVAPTLTDPIDGKREADRPIVLFAGPSRSGRTTMLEAIRETYRYTPVALITDDTTPKATGGEGAGDDDTDSHTTVSSLLALIVNRLGIHKRYRRYGVHKLDAFTVCFALLHAQDLKLPTAVNRQALKRFLRQLYFLRFARVHDLLEGTIPKVAPIVWWLSLVPWAAQILVRVAGFALYRPWRKRLAKRLKQCVTLGPGDFYQRLERLHSLYRNDPESEDLETAMCEVLLSDFDAFSRRYRRNAVNLVLVDDVEVDEQGHPSEEGPRGRLLRRMARAHADYQGKRPWGPLAIIGTCDGPPSEHTSFVDFDAPSPRTGQARPQTPPTPIERLGDAVKALHGDGSEPDSWFVTWRLPLPNRSDIRALCGRNFKFRDNKPVLDWIRDTGRGNVDLTRQLGKEASSGAVGPDWLVKSANLGSDHDHIDDYGYYRPPATPQQIRGRVYRVAAALVAVALTVTGGTVGCSEYKTWCDSSGDVYTSGPHDECVGISSGSYVFDNAFAETFEFIRKENERVVADNPDGGYVSIAIVVPMTQYGASSNTEDVESTLRQLQGAFLAQYQANHETANKPATEIRLLPTNPGANARQWEPVVDDLIARKDTAPDNLIGVAGLSSSYSTTAKMMTALTDNDIPIMASVATADDLLDGMSEAFRVAPDNSSQAQAMVHHLHRDSDVKTAMLVQDDNPHDPYTQTLGDAFKRYFPKKGRKITNTASYTSDKAGVADNFESTVGEVCSNRPHIVFFAGRGRGDLPDFIGKLGKRNCQDFPIRLVTGDDASNILDDPDKNSQGRSLTDVMTKYDITVEYSGLAHPGQWDEDTPHEGLSQSDRRLFEANVDRFVGGYETHFGDISALADSQAMMSFDAVTVLVEVIHRLGTDVDSGSLHNNLLTVNDCVGDISTLSGLVALNEDGDTVNKTMVIVRVDGPSAPEIIGLTWPEGSSTPIRDNC